jgi:hypothetical protein
MDQNLIHRIRERAYEIWAANGYRGGEAEQHWLTAEREILEASTATALKRPVARAGRSSARATVKKAVRLAS